MIKNLINKFFDIFTNLSDDFKKNLDYLYKNHNIKHYSFSSKEFLQISNNIKALKEYEECLQKLYDSINNLNENEIEKIMNEVINNFNKDRPNTNINKNNINELSAQKQNTINN